MRIKKLGYRPKTSALRLTHNNPCAAHADCGSARRVTLLRIVIFILGVDLSGLRFMSMKLNIDRARGLRVCQHMDHVRVGLGKNHNYNHHKSRCHTFSSSVRSRTPCNPCQLSPAAGLMTMKSGSWKRGVESVRVR
jgi:hypothetical protein